MIGIDIIAEAVHKIAREGFDHKFGTAKIEAAGNSDFEQIRNLGTMLWLDTGDIDIAKERWCSEFEALTTNNTLLNREVQKGIYDDLIKKTALALKKEVKGIDGKQLLLEIAFVLNAYHGLRLVEIFDAHVSIELHTDLANDAQRSVEYGKRYYAICPERFYVKIPLTAAGFLAARKLGELKIPVNFTLGFSARQNYFASLFSQPRFVNVFLGRLNSFVVDNGLGDGLNVGEKTTLATQRQILELRRSDKTKSLLIAASMRAGPQVAGFAGVDVYTMPPRVAAEYQQNPVKDVTYQVEKDLSVELAEGITFDDFNALTLWDVPEDFKKCVQQLLEKQMDRLTAEDIQTHFAEAGFEDFLPRWSDEDIKIIINDGKIPNYKTWKDRLVSGQIGLDALMNISAFYSFASDQQALDNRIKSLI